jgi:FkbM family methyltransferase
MIHDSTSMYAHERLKRPLLRFLANVTDASVQGRTFGQRLAYNAALAVLRTRWAELEITDVHGNAFHLRPYDVIDRQLLSRGVWEPHVTASMHARVRLGQTFYDIGANIGYNSLLASRLVGPTGHVIAFEPNPSIARRLRDHVERNRIQNVRVVEACVVAKATERARLYIPPRDLPNPGRATMRAETRFEPVECAAVHLDSLIDDRSLPPPDVIKIDVEGFEYEVLQSLESYLSRPGLSLTVLLEVTSTAEVPDRATSYLESLGFRLDELSPPYTFVQDGVPHTQHDAVFSKSTE